MVAEYFLENYRDQHKTVQYKIILDLFFYEDTKTAQSNPMQDHFALFSITRYSFWHSKILADNAGKESRRNDQSVNGRDNTVKTFDDNISYKLVASSQSVLSIDMPNILIFSFILTHEMKFVNAFFTFCQKTQGRNFAFSIWGRKEQKNIYPESTQNRRRMLKIDRENQPLEVMS